MNITSQKLVAMIAELHEVNRELEDAAQPLEKLCDLNEKQREAIGTRLRAGLARWREVTSRIQRLLAPDADDLRAADTE